MLRPPVDDNCGDTLSALNFSTWWGAPLGMQNCFSFAVLFSCTLYVQVLTEKYLLFQ